MGADSEKMHRLTFWTHDHHFLMVVELIDIEMLTEALKQSQIVAI